MTGQEINSIIETLAQSLGTSAEKLVSTYVPWIKVAALTQISGGAFLFVACVLTSACLLRKDDEELVWLGFLFLILSIVACAASLIAVPNFLAPEAAAITKVVAQIPR